MSEHRTYLTIEEQNSIRAAVDAYAWKHSWHFPCTSSGIDWSNLETLRKCVEVLRDHRRGAVRFAAKCDKLEELLSGVLAAREKEEEEEEDRLACVTQDDENAEEKPF